MDIMDFQGRYGKADETGIYPPPASFLGYYDPYPYHIHKMYLSSHSGYPNRVEH